MSGYIGTQPIPQSTQTRETFTATASQTSFATGGYQAGYIDVFLNGVKLVDGTDFTATNGSDVVLTTGAASGDTLEVVAYTAFEAANVTGATDFTVTGSFTSRGIDDNATSTAMTLDGSGNLLVGKTSVANTAAGGVIYAGKADLTRSDNGSFLDMHVNGTTVGSIASRAGVVSTIVLNPAGTDGAGFTGGTDTIAPTNGLGAVTNGELDLGFDNGRFKDLYLSGGVYLGGTGAANKLDDYEEGTWTPTWYGSGGSPTVSYGTQLGRYVKVGDVVFVSVRIDITSKSGGAGSLAIGGLPFTVSSTAGYFPAAYLGYKANFSTTGPDYLRFTGGTTRIEVHADNNTGETNLTPSNLSQTTAIIAGGFYQV